MRKINLTILAAALIAATSCSKNGIKDAGPESSNLPTGVKTMASATGDVVGKLVVGYQAWFGCLGDGSPFNSWKTWGPNPPSAGHINVEMWPDVREYATTYQTGFANLGNGQPAKLFTSYSQQVVNTHFLWMQQNGIDCVALQRFGSAFAADARDLNWRNGNATMVRAAAEAFGRKFFIEYDISGWTNFQTEIKTDWTTRMQTHTSSAAYAMQNGKPVVSIWGIGVPGRPGNNAAWLDVINWFKAQGCYVIIGVQKDWRADTTNTAAYNAANMIQPWTVGSFNGTAGADGYVPELTADFAYCNTHGQDYQPVVFPGFAWSNWHTGPQNEIPRLHGDFMWRQFYNLRNNSIPSVKVAMFDEYNEGTAIAKAAENSSMKPTDQYFLTLDADGVACSSDFYLRLTGDGAKMIKGQIGLTATHPTPHTLTTAPSVWIDHCDATIGWASGNTLSLNTTDKQEGTGALQSVGSGTLEFQKAFSAINTGATTASGKIDFWYYVSDATKFSASNQIEVGSGGAADVNEYSWDIGPLANGWNHITKTFASATVTGGTPNLGAINWFRIYHAKTASITTKVDAIQVIP